MDTRQFGRTGHMSTVAIFGAFALSPFEADEQDLADRVMEQVIEAGVNHIDVAPSYGHAEARLGPGWRGCATVFPRLQDDGAAQRRGAAELRASLERLRTDYVDLYQIHA
jgi:aryl-alcohol dehydrogenase-like predicted oxidoreductase